MSAKKFVEILVLGIRKSQGTPGYYIKKDSCLLYKERRYYSTVIVSQGWFCAPSPRGDIWQCLEVFLVITTGGEGALSASSVEARDIVKYSTMQRTVPTTKNSLV